MLATLQVVMYGAAPMPPTLLSKLMETYPDLGFHQAYGMTEICAIATGLTRGRPPSRRRDSPVGWTPRNRCRGRVEEPRHRHEPVAVGERWARSGCAPTPS